MKKYLISILAMMAMATAAEAHVGLVGHANGFTSGFLHPLSGLDHILAMVAVGVLAASLAGRALWLVPASFITAMAMGGALGMAGVAVPMVEPMIAVSVLVLGLLLALQWRVALVPAMGLVGFFAVFHGLAHGLEMPADSQTFGFGVGFVFATAALHVTGLALALAASNLRLSRWGGAVCAAAGLGLLAGWI